MNNKTAHSNTKRLDFQMRESPAPRNIPTPTPAPDRGGPVDCLGCPVASFDLARFSVGSEKWARCDSPHAREYWLKREKTIHLFLKLYI